MSVLGLPEKVPPATGLKTTETTSFLLLGAGRAKSVYQQGRVRSKGPEEASCLSSSSFSWLLVPFGFWPHHSSLCPCLYTARLPVSSVSESKVLSSSV